MKTLNETIKLYNHIVWFIKSFKRIPDRLQLSRYMNCETGHINKLLNDLVIQGKLIKDGDKLLVPGRVVKENIIPVKSEIEIPLIIKDVKAKEDLPIILEKEVLKNTNDIKEPLIHDFFNDSSEIEKNKPLKIKDLKSVIIKKNTNEILYFVKNINMSTVFNIIIFLVFIDFCYIGIKYNYYGNLNFKDQTDALTSAIAFMLASIVFFKKSIESFTAKKTVSGKVKHHKILNGLLFFCIYLALFCYNTGTVLQYQFDKDQDKLYSIENVKTISEKNKDQILDKKIKLMEDEIIQIEKEKSRQENILSTLTKEDEKYNFYFWQINGSNGFLKKLEIKKTSLVNLYDEKSKIIENTNIIKTEKKKLLIGKALKVYLFFPAFVIELLASISLVLLFNPSKRK
jgi:hypothetical protein